MAGKGSAIVDFGAFPGSNEASIAVTGESGIVPTSCTDAWIIASATSDHTINDHAYASALVAVTTGSIINGVGFTVYARCLEKMQGTFNIEWTWA